MSWELALTIAVGIALAPFIFFAFYLAVILVLGGGAEGAKVLVKNRIRLWRIARKILLVAAIGFILFVGVCLAKNEHMGLAFLWFGAWLVPVIQSQIRQCLYEMEERERRSAKVENQQVTGCCGFCGCLYTFKRKQTGNDGICPTCGQRIKMRDADGPREIRNTLSSSTENQRN